MNDSERRARRRVRMSERDKIKEDLTKIKKLSTAAKILAANRKAVFEEMRRRDQEDLEAEENNVQITSDAPMSCMLIFVGSIIIIATTYGFLVMMFSS